MRKSIEQAILNQRIIIRIDWDKPFTFSNYISDKCEPKPKKK